MKAGVVALLMCASFAGASIWRPSVKLADLEPREKLETLFPAAFGDWALDTRAPAQLVSPDTAALLNKIYNETLSRVYVNRRGDRVMLSVAYGGDQSDGTRAHRPEVCYPAQGFQVQGSREDVVSLPSSQLPVRRLVAKLGNRIEPITYWVVVGDSIALSGTEQKLAQLSYGFKGVVADGMLVRVSTIGGESAREFAVQQGFIADLWGALNLNQRKRVVGANG